jgi:hypothetical protein
MIGDKVMERFGEVVVQVPTEMGGWLECRTDALEKPRLTTRQGKEEDDRDTQDDHADPHAISSRQLSPEQCTRRKL